MRCVTAANLLTPVYSVVVTESPPDCFMYISDSQPEVFVLQWVQGMSLENNQTVLKMGAEQHIIIALGYFDVIFFIRGYLA